ncbi:MAG: MBL fold metallo-hydrolase [Methanomicrobia archaeon]|nr:MBL fold metallo-hydrolase [Methanomicrobia archaeon]
MFNVKPLAFDSFGVRSMATFVETDDIAVLIDPGVSLAPSRYGLPPHPIEEQRMTERWAAIKDHAARSDVLIVTHYHYDHHDPYEPEVYEGKIVYLKHPTDKINKSQAGRAAHFLEQLDELPKSLDIADGNEYTHGSTTITFSPAVYHGTNPRLGYVVEVSISCGDEKLVFTSDVEGPSVADQADFILKENPDLLILDGPMTYMLGFRYSQKSLELAIENINRIIAETAVRTLIVEHHFMRDLKYKERIPEVYDCAAENDVTVMTAAEYLGHDNEMLEARRKELYR